jgi:aromatic ring hydroxylase-like protein
VLVRPDGQIAWRSRGAVAEPAAELRRVVRRVLSLV